MLYNANLDRAKHKRKSLSDLRKELAKWEQLRDTKKPTTSSSSREYEVKDVFIRENRTDSMTLGSVLSIASKQGSIPSYYRRRATKSKDEWHEHAERWCRGSRYV